MAEQVEELHFSLVSGTQLLPAAYYTSVHDHFQLRIYFLIQVKMQRELDVKSVEL